MSITATKITAEKVIRGTSPSSNALPVISHDVNEIIDDLVSIEGKINGGQITPESMVLTKEAVTQVGFITSSVTVNASAGVITTVNTNFFAANSNRTFTVVNSFVTASSVILLTPDDKGSAIKVLLSVRDLVDGEFQIDMKNLSGNDGIAPVKIHFLIV